MTLLAALRPLDWRRVLLAAGTAVAAVYALMTAAVVAYAMALGFQTREAPDPARITAFASGVTPWAAPLGLALVTLWAARRSARRAGHAAVRHGLAVGAVVAMVSLALDLGLGASAFPALTSACAALLAGWAGGRLGARSPA